MMKLFVTFSLSSLAAAELRNWPSFLPKPPGGFPKLPPFLDFNLIPDRKFNGVTDPTANYHIGQSCSVLYEKRVYKGTCQRDDDFSKSAFGGCPTDVSLYGCGAERGDGNSMRCCVKVPCGKHWEKNNCMNKYKQPALFNAFHIDPNLCPFADDIACWVPELGQMESPTLYAAAPVGADLYTQGPTKDPNAPSPLLLLSTPSDTNTSPQIQSDNLSIAPPDANSSPQIESDNLSPTATDPNSSLQIGPNNLSSTPSDPNTSLQIAFDTPSSLPSIRRRSRKARTGLL